MIIHNYTLLSMPVEEGISGKARATGTLATLTLKTVNSPCHIKAPVQALGEKNSGKEA